MRHPGDPKTKVAMSWNYEMKRQRIPGIELIFPQEMVIRSSRSSSSKKPILNLMTAMWRVPDPGRWLGRFQCRDSWLPGEKDASARDSDHWICVGIVKGAADQRLDKHMSTDSLDKMSKWICNSYPVPHIHKIS